MKAYRPEKKILEKYADLLVNFALRGGKGIRKGDVVRITAGEYAKPLYLELCKAVWRSGGHVIGNYAPDCDGESNPDADFYGNTTDRQLSFFPAKLMKGLIDEIDHSIFIIGETNPHSLKGVDPKKIMRRGLAFKPFQEWRDKKEGQGRFSWTVALYGTEAMAKEAGMSIEEYWKEIIRACYLEETDPVVTWKKMFRELESYRKKFTALKVDRFHIEGPDADLWIKLGEKRKWAGGRGANIPSYELFTSPDWRGTEGWIRFNQPLYVYGNLIEGVYLEFKNGRVIRSSATKNEKVLKEMIATKDADKVGEFSLTDKRFSRVRRFMAETLYDENMGGDHGNTHIALGSSYHDCYDGNQAKVTKAGWKKLGFNDSSVHTDIVSTAPRMVTAHFKDGGTRIVYKDGQYVL